MLSQPLTPAQLRWLLSRVLPRTSDLDQLVIDYLEPEHPGFFAEYHGQRGRIEQTNLILLRWQGRELDLLQCLQQLRPTAMEQAQRELPLAVVLASPMRTSHYRQRVVRVGIAVLFGIGIPTVLFSHLLRANYYAVSRPQQTRALPIRTTVVATSPTLHIDSRKPAEQRSGVPKAKPDRQKIKVAVHTYDDCEVEFAGQRKQQVNHEWIAFVASVLPGTYTISCKCGNYQKQIALDVTTDRINYGPEKCLPAL